MTQVAVRTTVADLLAQIGTVTGYYVTWRSTYFRDGYYASDTFPTQAQAEHYARWLGERTGELAVERVQVHECRVS